MLPTESSAASTRTARSLSVTAACAALGALAIASVRVVSNQKLNGPLPAIPVASVGEVYELSSDGAFVVHDLQDSFSDGLFLVPADGSSSGFDLTDGQGWDVSEALFTPGGDHVVYAARAGLGDPLDLFSVPTDGSGGPVRLLEAQGPSALGLQVSPDGTRVLFLEQAAFGPTRTLMSVPVDGSENPVMLNGPLPYGGRVRSFEFLPGGSEVLFLADQVTVGSIELFRAPADGSSAAVKLNGPLVGGGEVLHYSVSPDGTMITYVAPELSATYDLFAIPVDGSQPAVKLNTPPVPNGNVQRGYIAPDNTTVVYMSDQEVNNRNELFVVPIDGSQAPLRVHPPVVPGGQVLADYRILSDSAHVVYRAEQDANNVRELYVAPLDGSQASIKLNGPMQPDGDVLGELNPFQISADGSSVLYVADQEQDHLFSLYASPLDGSHPAVRLSPAGQNVNGPVRQAPGARALFPSGGLWSVPIDGSAPAFQLNGATTSFENVTSYRLSSDGSLAVFRADTAANDVFELRAVPPDGSSSDIRISNDVPLMTVGNVRGWKAVPDGTRVFYEADQEQPGIRELYSRPMDGSGPPVRLSRSDEVSDIMTWDITADGTWAVYTNDAQVRDLYSAPAGGEIGPQRLNPPLPEFADVLEFHIPAGDEFVVYVADVEANSRNELYRAAIDGQSPVVKLSGRMIPSGSIRVAAESTTVVSPDGSRVLFAADKEIAGRRELFSVPVDGSSEPVKISGTLQPQGNVLFPVLITPDGSRAVWRSDADTDAVIELYSAPIDGSESPVKISGPMVSGGDVERYGVRITADSSRVVYRADQDIDDVIELYAAPIDGSAPATRLLPPLPPYTDVDGLELSPDGAWAVYTADRDVNGSFDLFSVPTDGTQPPNKLNLPFEVPNQFCPTGVESDSFGVSPDGETVVYCADQLSDVVVELFSVPIDGSSPPIRLNSPLAGGRDVMSFHFAGDTGQVLYVADENANDMLELFIVPARGGVPATRISDTLVPFGSLSHEVVNQPDCVAGNSSKYGWVPGLPGAVYIARQDDAQADELFVSRLLRAVEPGQASAGGPGLGRSLQERP